MSNNNKKLIEEAQLLATMKQDPGFKYIEAAMKETIERCKDDLVNKKRSKSMVEVARLQGKAEGFINLLYLIDNKIEKAKKLKNE